MDLEKKNASLQMGELTQLLNEWDQLRLAPAKSWLSRIPVLGKVFRGVARVLSLGRLLAIQSKFLHSVESLIEKISTEGQNDLESRAIGKDMNSHIEYFPIRVSFQHELEIAVDTNDQIDPIQKMIREGRYGNPAPFQLLFDGIRLGYRAIDIGCHIGTFSLGAAILGAEVIAIDGSRKNIELLRASIKHNDIQRLQVLHSAVAEKSGATGFVEAGAWGHISAQGSLNHQIIPKLSIDDLMEATGWKHVDIIKIDIEGSEIPAFKGMKNLLGRRDAPVLVTECNRPALMQSSKMTPTDLKVVLADYGYSLFMISGYELIRVEPEEIQVNTLVDYLCVKWDIELEQFLGENWIIREPLTNDEKLARLAEEAKMVDPAIRSSVQTVVDMLEPKLLETKLGKEIVAEVQGYGP